MNNLNHIKETPENATPVVIWVFLIKYKMLKLK